MPIKFLLNSYLKNTEIIGGLFLIQQIHVQIFQNYVNQIINPKHGLINDVASKKQNIHQLKNLISTNFNNIYWEN